jgi:hypothetical protein
MVAKLQVAALIGICAALAWIAVSLQEIAKYSGNPIEADCILSNRSTLDVRIER